MSFYDLLLECAFQIQPCIVGFFILNSEFVPIIPNKTDYWLNTRGIPSHLLITVKSKLIKHFCFNFTHTTQTKFSPAVSWATALVICGPTKSHLRSPTKSRKKPTGYISPSLWFAAQFRNFCPLRALEPTPWLNFSSNCRLSGKKFHGVVSAVAHLPLSPFVTTPVQSANPCWLSTSSFTQRACQCDKTPSTWAPADLPGENCGGTDSTAHQTCLMPLIPSAAKRGCMPSGNWWKKIGAHKEI